MITSLFEFLNNSLDSTPSVALTAAFVWGVLSVVLSPCHLASIPLIVAFIDNQGRITTKRAFLLSFLFSVGILFTIALIGVVTSLMGRMLGDVGLIGSVFVAVVFLLVGLHLLEIVPIPFIGAVNKPGLKRKGGFAAFLLGLIFGIALGPCTFAYMAPILVISFSVSATQLFYGVALLFLYGVGHCLVIVIAGTSMELVEQYLNWNENSKGAVICKKICGVLVFIAGIYMIYTCF